MTHEDETRSLVTEIATSLERLSSAVDRLSIDQTRYIKKTRRMLYWTITGLIMDLVLTAIGGLLYVQVQRNSGQLRAVNARVSTQALCPLYDLFLRSYNPKGPVAQANPAEYDRDFDVLEQGARALGCANTVRGHR